MKNLELENLKKMFREIKENKTKLDLQAIKDFEEIKKEKEKLVRLVNKSISHIETNLKYEKRITQNLKNHVLNILDVRSKFEIIFIEEIQNYLLQNKKDNLKINHLDIFNLKNDSVILNKNANEEIENFGFNNIFFEYQDFENIIDSVILKITESDVNYHCYDWRKIQVKEEIKDLIEEYFV
jgi:hypothetical protein